MLRSWTSPADTISQKAAVIEPGRAGAGMPTPGTAPCGWPTPGMAAGEGEGDWAPHGAAPSSGRPYGFCSCAPGAVP